MSWWVDFYKDADRRDIVQASSWFHDDMVLKFANRPPSVGKEAVIGALGHFLAMLDVLNHELGTVVGSGDEVFVESNVTYVYKDGSSLCVPAATYLKRTDGLVSAMHIYVDMQPHLESVAA